MVGELRDVRFRGRRALETAFFGYDVLLSKGDEWGLSVRATRWLEQEQGRLRRELRGFPRVDQYGTELRDSEEEEEIEEQEKVASARVVEKAEGSQKGKEKARDQ
jgi:hypothetical protein